MGWDEEDQHREDEIQERIRQAEAIMKARAAKVAEDKYAETALGNLAGCEIAKDIRALD